jgi:hypothetical protein
MRNLYALTDDLASCSRGEGRYRTEVDTNTPTARRGRGNGLSDEIALGSPRQCSESRDGLLTAAALAPIKVSAELLYLDALKGCGCFGVTVSVSVFKYATIAASSSAVSPMFPITPAFSA